MPKPSSLPPPLSFLTPAHSYDHRRLCLFELFLASATALSLFALFLHHSPPPLRPSITSLRSISLSPESSCATASSASASGDVQASHNPSDGEEGVRLKTGGGERTEFKEYGVGTALLVVYSAYRGGEETFAVVGLGSKSLYVYGEPEFECYWEEADSNSEQGLRKTQGNATLMLPDVGYGRVYTTVVVNCTFESQVGGGDNGGSLVIYANAGRSNDPLISEIGRRKASERIVALTEDRPYDASRFRGPPYQYDIMYCGSPLFGEVNAHRLRQWLVYHARLFGDRSHFVLQNAGGVGAAARAAIEPWILDGRVTLLDVTAEQEFDSYYHNQFLLVNDCLHRTRFLANWTFFFDVDEFLYVSPELSLHQILDWHVNDTLFSFEQLRMSDSLCLPTPTAENDTASDTASDTDDDNDRWVFENLVYGESFTDTKYAIQARHVYATGVHYPQQELGHMEGRHGWAWWPQMHFYHYHDTISKHGKLCTNITNSETVMLNGHNYTLDTTMVALGPVVRRFEQEYIHRFT